MTKEFTNLKELILYFDDEEICRDYLEKKRWGDSIICVHCKHDKIYRYRDKRRYRCSGCCKDFTVTVGTIFERSKIPLSSWFIAIYLFTSHKSSVSAVQMSKHLGISRHSAWFMHHRIMEAFRVNFADMKPEHGMWEVDEVYIGPKKDKLTLKRHEKLKRGTGFIHMTPLLCFLRRGHGLFGFRIPFNADRWTIQPIVKKYVDSMSVLMTDGSGLYKDMGDYFLSHEVFIHKKHQYARGEYHSNTIEGSFKHFKDSIRGSYKQLTEKHLQRYWDEFCFRYNNKNLSDVERFELIFNTINRKITYKQLIGYQVE